MSKDRLLSDETLKAKIIDLVTEAYDAGYSNGQMRAYSNEETLDIAGEITDFINTQKRLYAESVIGEDEEMPKKEQIGKSKHGKLFYTYGKGSSPLKVKSRNELRAEQRARINQ